MSDDCYLNYVRDQNVFNGFGGLELVYRSNFNFSISILQHYQFGIRT